MLDPDTIRVLLDAASDLFHEAGTDDQHAVMLVAIVHDDTKGDDIHEAFTLNVSTGLPGPLALKLLHDLAHETLAKFARAGLN